MSLKSRPLPFLLLLLLAPVSASCEAPCADEFAAEPAEPAEPEGACYAAGAPCDPDQPSPCPAGLSCLEHRGAWSCAEQCAKGWTPPGTECEVGTCYQVPGATSGLCVDPGDTEPATGTPTGPCPPTCGLCGQPGGCPAGSVCLGGTCYLAADAETCAA